MTTTSATRRRMMLATMLVAAGATAAGTLAPPATAGTDKFVAIHYSQTQVGQWGFAHGNNLDVTIRQSQANCNYVADWCVLAAWAPKGECVAISERGVNPNGGALANGGARGKTRRAAESAALQQSGGGTIMYSYCL